VKHGHHCKWFAIHGARQAQKAEQEPAIRANPAENAILEFPDTETNREAVVAQGVPSKEICARN
jgi:hypothetical protein